MFVATFDDQQMTVLHTAVELHTVGGQMLVEVVNQHRRILRLQVAAIVGDDIPMLQGDDVAADGHVVGSQLHANAGGLERSTTLIHLILVIAQNAAVGHLAARMEAILHRLQHTTPSHLCQHVHVGRLGILQQCLVSQRLHRPVCHAVA